MSLRFKMALVIVVVIVFQGAMDFANQHFTVLPRFAELEQVEAIKDLTRVEEAIGQQIETIDVLAYDWAPWDDTYEFVVDANEDYIDSNLTDSLFTTGNLSLVYICDSSGEVIWGKVVDPESYEEIQLKEFPQDKIPVDHPLMSLHETDSFVKGIMLAGDRALMVASRPILNSDEEGPIRGAVIMGGFITQEIVAEIQDQVQIDLEIKPIIEGSLSRQQKNSLAQITPNAEYFLDKSDSAVLQGFTTYPDLSGSPLLMINASITRSIMKEGNAAIQNSIGSLILVGLVSLLTVWLFIDRWVVIRLKKLGGLFSGLGASHEFSVRTTVHGSDEVGQLGKVVNNMLARLQQYDKELHESEERYRYLVEAMGEGIVTVEMEDHALFSFANPAAEKLFGVGPGELVGRRLTEFCDAAELTRIEGQLEIRKTAKVSTYEMKVTRDDHTDRLVQVTASPRSNSDGKFIGSFSLLVDITDLKLAEEELRTSAAKTAQLEGIRKTVATLAHEINNPLTGVIGNMQYALEADDAQEVTTEVLNETMQAALRIRDVVEKLCNIREPSYRPYIGDKEIIDIRDNAGTNNSE